MVQASARSIQATDTIIVALRAQLAAQQAFQSDLLSTVYWSLGLVIAIIAALFTFSWWTNFKVYERDLALIQGKLETLLKSELAAMRAALKTELSSAYATDLKGLESTLTTKIAGLRSDYLELRCDMRTADYAVKFDNKLFGSAATAALGLLRAAVAIGWSTYINSGLEKLVESLGSGGYLTPRELQEATELLNSVPDSFAVLRDRARQAVNTAKTKP